MNVGLAENGLSGGVCVEDFNEDGLWMFLRPRVK